LKEKLAVALVSILAIAVVARVVWQLLGPLLPYLMVIVVLGGLLMFVIGGPRAHR
jgi:hypothetical protein